MNLPALRYRWNRPAARWLAIALVAAAAALPAAMWTRRLTQAKSPLLSEAELLYAPTPPVPLKRMFAESAPTAALVVALPETQVLGTPRKEAFFLRLIEIAARYVKVVILVDREDSLAPLKVTQWIQARVRSPAAVLPQVTLVRSLLDTEWVRDYGPLFGLSMDNELVLLDNMYRDLRGEADTARTVAGLGFIRTDAPPAGDSHGGSSYLSDYGVFWRRNDDAASLYFNEFLYTARHRFSPLVRPPLVLAGGDAAFTETGHMFTSTRTLELNGGHERRFSRLAKEYFAADRVTCLRPLPNSIWHIDMFFRIAGPGVVMLGEFPDIAAPASESAYLRLLRREAVGTLEWNRALIAERLPGVEVIRVPMPQIVLAPHAAPTESGPTGLPELDSAAQASGATVKPLSTVIYRSFLNSVFLNGGPGRSAVLVPGFAGLEAMEGVVAQAYRRAYPGADIHFIPADVMAEEFGSIHCVTVTIPEVPASAN